MGGEADHRRGSQPELVRGPAIGSVRWSRSPYSSPPSKVLEAMLHRTPSWVAAAVTILLLVFRASELSAQKPGQRTLVPVRTYTSTPARLPYTASIARQLNVPSGFAVSVFAEGLGGPRMLAVGEDGTVYVTRRDSNDVLALRDDGSGRAVSVRKVITDLRRVHGIALHEGKMYLATVKEVYVARLGADGSVTTPTAIITNLPDGGQHPNRTLGIGPDGMLYIAIGSTCNVCNEPNEEHATLLRAKPDGSDRGIYSRGLRNTVGFAWDPKTGVLWGMDHGSDGKGNDIPPEELNQLQISRHYGWPYCYGDRVPDRYFSGQPAGSSKVEFCPRTAAPVLSYRAHAAPIQMAFYTGRQFPAEYRGDVFVALRGSWNREPPTGYGVLRIAFRNGKPVRMEEFLRGFLRNGGTAYTGRPAGLAVAKDGSLLLSDDTNGAIYRIAFTGGKGPVEPTRAYRLPSPDTTATVAAGAVAPAGPRRLGYVDSLAQPESIKFDADQKVYFVSNIAGPSLRKDGVGFISRFREDGTLENRKWIQAGRKGALLNAPKGMAIVGDTLWVADIDVVRGFNRHTGAPIGTINLVQLGATFLNDISVGPDGIYVTDTQLRADEKGLMFHPAADKVYRIGPDRRVSVALETDRLGRPNGIAWNPAAGRFLIVSAGDTIMSWRPGERDVTPVLAGPGQADGVVIQEDGTVLISSWATSSVHALQDGKLRKVVEQVSSPADIEFNRTRGVLAVPLLGQNRVEFYRIP
jgi:glucose/arabinose dehydrogenase